MTVRDNPVRRIMLVRKVGGKLVVDIQGTVRAPIKLKLASGSTPKKPIYFPRCGWRNESFSHLSFVEAA